jgi:hypothetical protein
MHTHSVSCWRLSDKDAAIFASVNSPVRWSTQPASNCTILPSHDRFILLTSAQYRRKATRPIPAQPTEVLSLVYACPLGQKRPLQLRLATLMLSADGVFTFGRTGVHFRENATRPKATFPAHSGLKTPQSLVFTIRKRRDDTGVHFRENRCSL